MQLDNHTNPSLDDNPYHSPEKTVGQDLSQLPGRRKRFRKRLLPATLLFSVCPSMLVLYVFFIGMVVYTSIHDRWIDPDLEAVRHFSQRVLSPPVVAHCVFGIAAASCGIFAAFAWMRGNWRRAVVLTAGFLVLMMIAGYVSAGREFP